MITGKIRGYVYSIGAGLVLLAGLLLLVLQGGYYCDFTVFGRRPMQANVAVVMLFSALGGVAVLYVIRLLVHGVGMLRRARQRELLNLGREAKKASDASGQ